MSSDSLTNETSQQIRLVEWLALVLILPAFAPLLYVYFQQLWSRPHYQFFPLVLVAFVALVVARWSERETPATRMVIVSRVLLLAAAAVLAMAIARLSPFAAYLSFIMAAGACLIRLGIPATGPWLLLLLMLRIPYGQDIAAIQTMQRVTTNLSGIALDLLGVEHFVEGNVLVFPSRSLFVEEACSGVVSMLAIVACGGILAAWSRRSLTHGLLLIASGVFWAGAMNVFRVVTIALALTRYDVDLSQGWPHETLGLTTFAISLAALLSTDRLLLFLITRIRRNPLADYWNYAEENYLVRLWNIVVGPSYEPAAWDHVAAADDWEPADDATGSHGAPKNRRSSSLHPRPWEWVFVPVFLVLGAVQVVAGIGPFSGTPSIRESARNLNAEDFPEQLDGWRRIDFESLERDSSSAFGEHSRIWTYENGRHVAKLSLDFVFPEWHALTACYEGIGWETQSQSRIDPDSMALEAILAKPNGEHAYLVFDVFDENGIAYAAPDGSILHPQLRRILSGDANRFTLPSYYQVQLLTGLRNEKLPSEDREKLQQLFREFATTMKSHVSQ